MTEDEISEGVIHISNLGKEFRHTHVALKELMGDEAYAKEYPATQVTEKVRRYTTEARDKKRLIFQEKQDKLDQQKNQEAEEKARKKDEEHESAKALFLMEEQAFQDKLQNGFGFLPDVIVMNHFLSRNKQFRHTQALHRLPKYIGIGIDDNTGIFIENGVFEVIGQSYVAMYDGTNYLKSKDSIARLPIGSERFYLLRNGDRYSLTKRQVLSPKRLKPLVVPTQTLKNYEGKYVSTRKKPFGITCTIKQGTLYIANSWGWKPYPVFAYKKDVFFAKNRVMWFRFVRDDSGEHIVGVQKLKSLLQEQAIADMKRVGNQKK